MATEDKLLVKGALAWFRSHHKSMQQYSGQWVAIGPKGVLMHHNDLKIVVAESKKKGFQQPLLYKVPPEGLLALWRSTDA
jgi:hypothetical protein